MHVNREKEDRVALLITAKGRGEQHSYYWKASLNDNNKKSFDAKANLEVNERTNAHTHIHTFAKHNEVLNP